MKDAFFFGYGSLVNRLTHGFDPAHPATLSGWRRAWRATAERKVAYLTAIPDAGCTIKGLIAPVPGDSWAALDIREAAYNRHSVQSAVIHNADDAEQIAVYAIAPERILMPSPEHPVLLSYLDVVIQGYLAEFGKDGATHFFETTIGWEAPILDDRDSPRYPRAQRLTDAERSIVDTGLRNLGCMVLPD
ncbi:gamma-glutamylcyclotransferase family protein [Thalassococcus lentus]|uniref:Gamma-glutamylcyclotransferase n=1 Tax=Thalassococcus lentus TaxID=1210524 RepID=A0ABT4XMV8_9RHOB|nr:gamma-glutamylcyclotransferase family protein [Thalassococcus lentus]MDA7423279.1 gamma-glutamylcyclotransferase [Thalassococcus lentus]